MITILLLTASVSSAYCLINSFLNRNAITGLRNSRLHRQPLVSVLIPCRNEQDHISSCIDAFLAQEYKAVEILILDDHSEDRSAGILSKYAQENDNIKIIRGKLLPDGWTGKNWACHQLYESSAGDVLLYCDADTKIGVHLLRDAVATLESQSLGFVTIFPNRESQNIFDRWIWAFTSWVVASWIPLWAAYQTRIGILGVGFGQFLMLRRTAYEAIGGYEAFRGNSLDDFEIGRRVQANGINWRVYRGMERLTTASYGSTKDAVEGYGKSIFPALGRNGLILLLAWLFLANMTWTPVALLILESLGIIRITTDQLQLASFCIMAILISWASAAVKLKISILNTVFYPIAITAVLYTAIRSYLGIRRGTIVWKDRAIAEKAESISLEGSNVVNTSIDSVTNTSAGNSES